MERGVRIGQNPLKTCVFLYVFCKKLPYASGCWYHNIAKSMFGQPLSRSTDSQLAGLGSLLAGVLDGLESEHNKMHGRDQKNKKQKYQMNIGRIGINLKSLFFLFFFVTTMLFALLLQNH